MICVYRMPGAAKRDSLVFAMASETKSSCLAIPRIRSPSMCRAPRTASESLRETEELRCPFHKQRLRWREADSLRNQRVDKRGEKDACACAGVEDSDLLRDCLTHRRHKPCCCGRCEELTYLSAATPVCLVVEGFTNMVKRMQGLCYHITFVETDTTLPSDSIILGRCSPSVQHKVFTRPEEISMDFAVIEGVAQPECLCYKRSL